jgi:magnesium-transporting ATPase (P-type)
MAKPMHTPEQWQRGVRALIIVSVINGAIISLLVQWFMGRVEVLPTLIGIIAFCIATIPPSLWLLRRHLEADAQMRAAGLGRRRQR